MITAPIVHGALDDGFDLFLLGDPDAGWMPSPDAQEQFVHLLEEIGYTRPCIVYHYGLKFERIDGEGRFVVGDAEHGWAPPEAELIALREEIAKHMTMPFTVVRVTVPK
jgi:hypothetical protein